MYNPNDDLQGPDFENEWVEIRNEGCETVDLYGWTISDRSSAAPDLISPLDGGPTGLLPGQYALIIDGEGSQVLSNRVWDIAPGTRIFGTDDAAIGNGLGNGGDDVTLMDSVGNVVDMVVYDDTDASGCGNEADGKGYSLERVDPLGPGDCTNFRSMELLGLGFPIGGTPGADNDLWIGSLCECPTTAACLESVNPSGENTPPAGSTTLPGSRGGQNDDGFYELIGEDIESAPAYVFVTNASSSPIFGPFESGSVVKITEVPGATPTFRPMGGPDSSVVGQITLDTDAVVFAVDSSGVESWVVSCAVPPPPK